MPTASPSSRFPLPRLAAWALALAALGAGIALRAWHIAGEPFWLDEAYSAYAADHGWRFLWTMVPAYETHPPVYYSLVRLWSLAAGETVLARRLLGIVAGLAAVGATAAAAAGLARLLALDARDRRWLIAAALLLACLHPLMIEMSRQVRPYPLMTLAYAGAIPALVRLARDAAGRRPLHRGALAGFFAAQAAMLWLHSLGPLYGATMSLALAVLVLRRGLGPRDWLWLVGGHVVVALVYLPGFLIMLGQASGWVQATWLVFKPWRLGLDLRMLYATWNLWAGAAALALALAGVALMVRRAPGRRMAAALVLLATLPVALSLALTITVSPVFIVRTLSPCTVPALLLIARGLVLPRRWRWPALLPLAALLVSMATIDWRMANGPPQQNWYGTARWLAARFRAGDVVWAYPNEGALPLDYALRDLGMAMPVRPIPVAVPAIGAGGFYPTGSRGVVSLYPAEMTALVARPEARAPGTIWLLRLGPWAYDKGDLMVKALAAQGRVPVGRWRSGPIDIVGLRRR